MTLTLLIALSVAVAGAVACDRAEPEAAPQAEPPPKVVAKNSPSPHGPNPHAQAPHAAPAAKPLGPPRDVTPSGETREELVEDLKLAVPSEWTREPGVTSMRKAEFTLPGPGGDVRMVVYRFQGGAGSAADNIARWKGQVEAPAGEEAATAELEASGMKIDAIDVRGRFAGQSMPGAPPQPPIEDARLLAAAIMGPGDPFYLKLVGPAKTVDVWAEAWTKLLSELAPAA